MRSKRFCLWYRQKVDWLTCKNVIFDILEPSAFQKYLMKYWLMAPPSVARENIKTSLLILREWPYIASSCDSLENNPSSRQCMDTGGFVNPIRLEVFACVYSHFECGRGCNTFDPPKYHPFPRNYKSWSNLPNFHNEPHRRPVKVTFSDHQFGWF